MNTQPIRVKYVGGMLQPLGSIGLSEGDEVMIHLETSDSVSSKVQETHSPKTKKLHYLEALEKLRFESNVTDGSTNIDKYIYDNPHR